MNDARLDAAHIGERVKSYRAVRGLYQDELARRIGKTKSVISRIERNQQDISVHLLLRLAAALEITPVALLSDVELVLDESRLPLLIELMSHANLVPASVLQALIVLAAAIRHGPPPRWLVSQVASEVTF